ncbi:MAG: hypothetical protein WED33_01620 [Bacteroidia bacterium]
MKYRFYNYLFYLSIIIAGLSSCQRDGITEWDTDILAPLAEARLTVADLFADSLIISDEGQPLVIKLDFDYKLIPDDSLLRIPDTLLTDDISLPINFNLPSGFEVANISQLIRFSYKDVQLTEAILESGYAEFTIINSLDDKVFFDYSLPKVSFNGSPIAFNNLEVPASNANGPSVSTNTIDLSNHYLDLRGDNSLNSNQIRFLLNATLNPAGDGSLISANTPFITYKNRFYNLKPSFARGFLGQSTFEFNDGSDVALMKKISGLISLEDILLNISLENSIGADFRLRIENIEAVKGNNSISLQHPIIGTNENISRAQNISFESNPYTPTLRSYTFNTSNSNIKSLAESLPERFNYRIFAQLNPLGNISSGNDFVYSTSNITLNASLVLPLRFSASNVVFRDTILFEGLKENDTRNFGDGQLSLIATNGFPFDMSVELEMLDTNFSSLSTFFIDQNIAAASVDSELKVSEERISTISIPVTNKTKDDAVRARFIVVNARINTNPANQLLPLYKNYALKLQLIGDGKYRIQIK